MLPKELENILPRDGGVSLGLDPLSEVINCDHKNFVAT